MSIFPSPLLTERTVYKTKVFLCGCVIKDRDGRGRTGGVSVNYRLGPREGGDGAEESRTEERQGGEDFTASSFSKG